MAIDRFGGADELHPVDLPSPVAGRGEVLIQIVASGVNPVDGQIVAGRLEGRFPHRFPLVPGWELAGTVQDMGEGVIGLRRGERVFAYARKPVIQEGTYAEAIALPETSVAPMPRKLLWEEASGVPLAGLTAWQSLRVQGDVGPDRTVLVHAAAGGVGHLAVQLAREAGARVIGTASARNREFVLSLGADEVVDHAREDFREAVRRVCPAGVDVALDTVGGDTLARTFDVVAPGGRLVGIVSPPDEATAAARGIRAEYVFVSPSGEQLRTLAGIVDRGRLRPHVSRIYPLAQAADALREIEGRHVRGKLVLAL